MTETVKQGYKQTEVGVIPEDWQARSLGSLGVFSKGQGIRKAEAASGDIPCIRYGEIYTHHNDVVRIYNSYISQEVAQTSKRIRKGDILFAGSGETKEEIGKAVAFLGDDEVYVGGDIVIFSPQAQSSEFLGYLLNTSIVVRQKASRGQGDAVVHISASALSAVCFPLPPFPEQRAIAAVLSDVDALIAKLDQLIAKKRDLKQAAMQQLLTGQTRLPGFSGEWVNYRIGDIANIGRGRVISHKEISSSISPIYPVYSSQTSNNGVMGYLDSYDFEGEYITWTTDGVNAGKVFYRHGRFNCTNVCGTIYLKGFDSRFVAMALDRIARKYVSTNLANPKLMNGVMKKIKIHLPNTPKDEQTAIATILSDMDAEIAALEAHRDKTCALKQGMMQELLTGRIRLL